MSSVEPTPLSEHDMTRVVGLMTAYMAQYARLPTQNGGSKRMIDTAAWVDEAAEMFPIFAAMYADLMERAKQHGLATRTDSGRSIELTWDGAAWTYTEVTP